MVGGTGWESGCDLGCGPGQVAHYLRSIGANACGIDLSAQMVRQAQRLNPDIPFQQGNMLALTNVAESFYGGTAAFYSIIHIPKSSVIDALREIKRVLRPQGVLLLTFHIGNQIVQLEQWWEKPVHLEFIFYETEEMKGYLQKAGFDLLEVIERDPYPDVEHQSRRAYLFTQKPSIELLKSQTTFGHQNRDKHP
ncbi:MAG: class I SAM-dependent methyltransferase [Acidobacteria bacterium]|nr:class I SAM-dependent methyltransferase [Acidobacteriota bacterium]